ncbi:ABC transporter related protein [Solidesulfovibrio fructosivorans JJ]]|uniref:ABC transporter related protein n=1 Tax=Solidesulfovibrio fructosivorans JJ] TaxID=596151 RepID=E1K0A0_SOLFR|nr:ABC transporter ATP-binding protein [Solidesulfovibrio fructosivorans]EFL49931.1 ABC transporter related protein [Solidesulfovibrio fructosivorans JJ]]
MLTLRNVDIHYGRVHAVRRVSLHVAPGEIVALIGANGAGKTTLLSAISGLLRVSAGEVLFDGRSIAGVKPERIVRLGLSHVPERRLVFGPMTVEDNLLLGAYSRYKRREALADRDAMYDMFPVLAERRGQQAAALSGGEQQMLAIGRALMARPRCLLLDEPGMGLAPQVCKEIFRHVGELRRDKGLTVLLVEQNAKSALAVADRGYVLETGRVLLSGTSEQLLANHDVRRAYLGREKDA